MRKQILIEEFEGVDFAEVRLMGEPSTLKQGITIPDNVENYVDRLIKEHGLVSTDLIIGVIYNTDERIKEARAMTVQEWMLTPCK